MWATPVWKVPVQFISEINSHAKFPQNRGQDLQDLADLTTFLAGQTLLKECIRLTSYENLCCKGQNACNFNIWTSEVLYFHEKVQDYTGHCKLFVCSSACLFSEHTRWRGQPYLALSHDGGNRWSQKTNTIHHAKRAFTKDTLHWSALVHLLVGNSTSCSRQQTRLAVRPFVRFAHWKERHHTLQRRKLTLATVTWQRTLFMGPDRQHCKMHAFCPLQHKISTIFVRC